MIVSCSSGKRPYFTKMHAKQAARQLHSHGRALARAYHCPECGFWHLTTASAKGREVCRAIERSRLEDVRT